MIYWLYREEPDLTSSADRELITSGRERTDERAGQLLHLVCVIMAKHLLATSHSR